MMMKRLGSLQHKTPLITDRTSDSQLSGRRGFCKLTKRTGFLKFSTYTSLLLARVARQNKERQAPSKIQTGIMPGHGCKLERRLRRSYRRYNLVRNVLAILNTVLAPRQFRIDLAGLPEPQHPFLCTVHQLVLLQDYSITTHNRLFRTESQQYRLYLLERPRSQVDSLLYHRCSSVSAPPRMLA